MAKVAKVVPAAEVEALLARAVRAHLEESTQTDDSDLISTHVVRVEVHVASATKN
jgi:hypothetical protein